MCLLVREWSGDFFMCGLVNGLLGGLLGFEEGGLGEDQGFSGVFWFGRVVATGWMVNGQGAILGWSWGGLEGSRANG